MNGRKGKVGRRDLQLIEMSLLEEGSWLAGSDDDPIEDQTDVAIESLLERAETDDGPRSWREADEVRHFARYAVACPAGLARERALLEIGRHAVRPAQEFLPDGHGRNFQRFGLVSDEVDVNPAWVEVCRLLTERCRTSPAEGTDAQSLAVGFGLYVTLMQVAIRFDLFESPARNHAMLALDAISGARLGAIREEVWGAWWRTVGPELQEIYRATQRRATDRGAADTSSAAQLEKLR